MTLAELAAAIQRAADAVVSVALPEDIFESPDTFGKGRVFIADAAELAGLTLSEVKTWIVEAHQKGLLTLVRADLVEAMLGSPITESEVHGPGRSTFHQIIGKKR